jgi:archaellum biogenesis protein FlaJ (TadC family)
MMGEFEDKAKAQVEDAKHYKTRYSAMFLCASLLALYSAIGTIVNPKGRAQAANNQVLPKPSL